MSRIEYWMSRKSHRKQTNVTPQTYVLRHGTALDPHALSDVVRGSCGHDSTSVRCRQGVWGNMGHVESGQKDIMVTCDAKYNMS